MKLTPHVFEMCVFFISGEVEHFFDRRASSEIKSESRGSFAPIVFLVYSDCLNPNRRKT